MKIRADEHVSIKVIRAVREVVLKDGIDLSHVEEQGQRGQSDVYWTTAFRNENGTAVLTADRGFTKGWQRQAIEATGLQIILLPKKWAESLANIQAAFILFWRSKIENAVKEGNNSDIWTIDWGFNEKGELKKHIKKKK